MVLVIVTLVAKAGVPSNPTARPVPMLFFPSNGVAGSPEGFVAETPDEQVWFQPTSVSFRTQGSEIVMRFFGQNYGGRLEGGGLENGRANFLLGKDKSRWRTQVNLYNHVVYWDLYPGIDLSYSGASAELKSEFTVSAGADPRLIEVDYSSSSHLSVDSKGNLVIGGASAELREEAPYSFQNLPSGRVRVESRYRLLSDHIVAFAIGAYDHSRPLIIDPPVVFSSYLGGSAIGVVTGIATDGSGALYSAGWTEALDFPIGGLFNLQTTAVPTHSS